MEKVIRVLLVDDHEIVRDGLRKMLQLHPTIQVVGEAGNAEDALRLANLLGPDVILMDIKLPHLNGLEATKRLKASNPAHRVIILSFYEQYLAQAVGAGASGYLTKDLQGGELVDAILRVVSGGMAIGTRLLTNPSLIKTGLQETLPTQPAASMEEPVNSLTTHNGLPPYAGVPDGPGSGTSDAPAEPESTPPQGGMIPALGPLVEQAKVVRATPAADEYLAEEALPQAVRVQGAGLPRDAATVAAQPPALPLPITVAPQPAGSQDAEHEHSPLAPVAHKEGKEEVCVTAMQEAGTVTNEGDVELLLPPPVSAGALLRFFERVQKSLPIDIIELVGSWDQGTSIRVALRRPVDLIDAFIRMAEVADATEESMSPRPKGSPQGRKAHEMPLNLVQKRIRIHLKDPQQLYFRL